MRPTDIIARGRFYLNHPEYIWRPHQLVWRLSRLLVPHYPRYRTVTLPWGLPLIVDCTELIGRTIYNAGVFDLAVTETIFRLLNMGDTAIDVGANIGYTTSVMCSRIGSTGQVLAIEPHPLLVRHLQRNVELWSNKGHPTAAIWPVALSDQEGSAYLTIPRYFSSNRGLARLANEPASSGDETIRVPVKRLDDITSDIDRIKLVKIDVEGHEYPTLQGANNSLSEHKVANIVFEDYERYPSRVMKLLQGHGYTLFGIDRTFFGPKLEEAARIRHRYAWSGPSYLATLDPDRAVYIMRKIGWSSLRPPLSND
jgi:FkbM family methyltransferase